MSLFRPLSFLSALDTKNLLTAGPLSLIAGSLAAYVVGSAVYNLWFHPLRHIPGPWYAAISPLYLTVKDLQFVKAHVIHDMLTKYGGVVRIAPNQVAFLDHAGIRTVYGGSSKFDKSVFYKALCTNNNDHAMTILESQRHAPRRRAYGPHYTPANLALYQPEMHEFLTGFVDKMAEVNGKTSFECLLLFRRLLIDIMFVTTYGQRFDAVKTWDHHDPNAEKGQSEKIIKSVHLFPIRGVIKDSVPTTIFKLLNQVPAQGLKDIMESDQTIASYVIQAKNTIIANDPMFKETGEMGAYNGLGDERLSLVHRLLRHSLKVKAEDKLSVDDVVSEGMAHTIAGVDTTATVLAYMCYVLTWRHDILAKLRAELDVVIPAAVDGEPRMWPDIAILNKLPYLTCFVKESLRIYGSAPSLLERIVPDSLDGPFVVNGYTIPSGTMVATQSWSTQRHPDVFPDPEEFKPERWLDETDEMRFFMMPFGFGQRICAGMNLAQMSLRLIIAAVVRDFDITCPPETTPESMALRFAFALIPASEKVPLVFKTRRA